MQLTKNSKQSKQKPIKLKVIEHKTIISPKADVQPLDSRNGVCGTKLDMISHHNATCRIPSPIKIKPAKKSIQLVVKAMQKPQLSQMTNLTI